uniref:Uncharacterized protein n=1 Tax=Seminavis robusta TaxID=568900 RepID=A0A3Q8R1U6_9STRA|nr:hypothetical protein [Seminavis robusta]|eukprot:Sro51_chlor_g029360.1 ORF-140 (141) ;mRNA; r:8500-8922
MGIKKRIKRISSTALQVIPNGDGVRDTILNQGMKATEASAYFWGNATKAVQDSSKGALTAHSGKRIATTSFKAATDFGRGDPVCGTLCTISACCETASGVIVWIPFPGKICTLSGLKAISIGCERVRDLCAREPNNPMCK